MRRDDVVKGFFLLLLALLLVLVVTGVSWGDDPSMDEISSESVAGAMFGDGSTSGYALVVFMIGLLLLVAILGGAFLAKEEKE